MSEDLTRDVLRAELRAGLAEQTNALRREMDERFRPLNDHVARMDRGEFTPAQRAAVLATIREEQDERLERRSWRAPIVAVGISALSLAVSLVITLGQVFSG